MMQCTRAKAGGVCCVASTLVIIGIVLFLTKWMNGDTTTIDNDGDNNKFETKHEVSLLHIENLASGQRFTNLVMIGGFLVIVLLAGYSVFHSRTSKASRRKIKDLERAQLFDKIQAIEDEMVTRGFMAAKRKTRKPRKEKKKTNKVKLSKLEKTGDIEAQKDEDSEDNSSD